MTMAATFCTELLLFPGDAVVGGPLMKRKDIPSLTGSDFPSRGYQKQQQQQQQRVVIIVALLALTFSRLNSDWSNFGSVDDDDDLLDDDDDETATTAATAVGIDDVDYEGVLLYGRAIV